MDVPQWRHHCCGHSKETTNIATTEFAKSVTVFDNIRWISSAWNNIREETVLNCSRRAGFASPESDLQEQEDSTSESSLVTRSSAFWGCLRRRHFGKRSNYSCAWKHRIHCWGHFGRHNDGQSARSALRRRTGDGRRGKVDQQPPNRPPSHSEALQNVHSLMQFAQANLPYVQPTLIKIYNETERNWATANIQKKKQTTLHQFFTTPKWSKKVLFM